MARPLKTIEPAPGAGAPLLYETHAHTLLCRHATGSAEAYCLSAIAAGLTGLVFCEHNPMPASYSHQERLLPGMLPSYVALVRRIAHSFRDRLDVRLGIECDFLPTFRPFLESQTARFPFDYVVGSIHCQFPEFLALASPSEPEHFEAVYFELMGEAAETGLFDTLAHPHLCNIILKTHAAINRKTVLRFLDRLAETPVALELNTSGRRFWDPLLYAGAARRGIPAVIAGDAHAPSDVGAHFAAALTYLRQAGYTTTSTILGRRRIDTPLDDALDHLRAGSLLRA